MELRFSLKSGTPENYVTAIDCISTSRDVISLESGSFARTKIKVPAAGNTKSM